MNEQQQVEILLKEYDTLRAEILQRIGHRFQFVSVAGGLAAIAFFRESPLLTAQLIVLAIGGFLSAFIWFWFGRMIADLSKRLSQLEARINSLAGADLLQWETMQLKAGLLHKIHTEKRMCEQDSAANGSQPIRSETNRTSSAAGSRR